MTNLKQKTVLFCFHDGNKNNGANRSLLDVIDNLLAKNDIRVLAAFPVKEGTALDYLKSRGVYIVPLCYGRWDYKIKDYSLKNIYVSLKKFLSIFFTHRFVKKVKPILIDYHVDLVYNNTITLPVGALIKKKYHIPLVWHVREFGREDHNLSIIGGERFLYKYMNDYSDKVILISESLASKYRKYIKNDLIDVIYNDISPEYIINNRSKIDLKKKCDILIAGTLQPGKGQMEAIKAIEGLIDDYPYINLFVAGTTKGEYYFKLKEYVEKKHLFEVVHFLGYVSDMNELRKKMDMAIVASSNEAFGRVTIEAMLSRLLVIGANCAGTRELIVDKSNGLLYNPGDIDDLIRVIKSIIDNSDMAQNIVNMGQKEAIEKYTTGKSSDKIHDIIMESVVKEDKLS